MVTKREIAKGAKNYIIMKGVAAATYTAATTVIDEPTETQETVIGAGSIAVGVATMYAVKSRTDQMIDNFADWRANRKAAKTVAEVVA